MDEKKSVVLYIAAKRRGCSEDRSWCCHSYPNHYQHLCCVMYLSHTYPRYPGPLVFPKGNLPSRLKRLEEFIWLEKGADSERIQETKADQK